MKLFSKDRTGPVAAIVVQDVLWTALLVPVAVAYRGVLTLAKGYYAVRAKGPLWSALYSAAVVTLLVLIVRRIRS